MKRPLQCVGQPLAKHNYSWLLYARLVFSQLLYSQLLYSQLLLFWVNKSSLIGSFQTKLPEINISKMHTLQVLIMYCDYFFPFSWSGSFDDGRIFQVFYGTPRWVWDTLPVRVANDKMPLSTILASLREMRCKWSLTGVFNMIFLVVTGMLGEHHFVWLCHLHQPALEHGIERFLGWVAMDLDFF